MSGKIGEAQAQTPLFNYKEKAIYTTGTGSRNLDWWYKSKWVNGELKNVEKLFYIDDIAWENQYSEEKVNAHYTLKDSLNNRIIEVNTVEELPQNWQIVISKYEKQWEAERIEEEKRMKEREKEFEQSLKQQLFDNISSRRSSRWAMAWSTPTLYAISRSLTMVSSWSMSMARPSPTSCCHILTTSKFRPTATSLFVKCLASCNICTTIGCCI